MPNKHPAFNQHSNCCLILCVILTYAGSYPYTIISRDLRWMTPEVTVSPLRWEGNGPASKLTRLLEQLLDSTTGIHLKQTGRRRRSHISHRPDPAAAEDRVKASVTAPITLNTLYSGSQWPYITSVWSWLDNGPRVFLCVHVSRPRSPRASFKEVFLGEHSNTGRRHVFGAWTLNYLLVDRQNLMTMWRNRIVVTVRPHARTRDDWKPLVYMFQSIFYFRPYTMYWCYI